MNRTSIIRGPAIINFGAVILHSEEDITVNTEIAVTEGKTAVHGKYDEFMDTVIHTISFKPASQLKTDVLMALFPYFAPVMGASVFGAAPQDLVVHSVDGKQYTYKVAALTQMPNLSLSPSTPFFDGEAVFTALGNCEEAWSSADHFTSSTTLPMSVGDFDPSKDIRAHYLAQWGNTAPWDAIETESGFKIAFDLQLEDVLSDSYGIVDKTFTGLTVSATFTPQGISPEQVVEALGIQGAGAKRGRSMSAMAQTLWLHTGIEGEPSIQLKNTTLKGNTTQFGASVNRVGELTLTTQRSLHAGLGTPVFNVGLFVND